MANNSAPKDLFGLLTMVQETAKSFGYLEGQNGLFRDCVSDKSNKGSIRTPSTNEANFWFGYIREDQPTSGAYDGLSYVIFPENKNTRCLVAIGIGSSSIGKDGDLASSPGFRRSFIRLNKAGESGAAFFYKLRFDEMETSTPGLQEELYSEKTPPYEDVIIDTTTKYNADSDKESPGLLPAAFIVDYTTEDGWNLIKAWLAQYAKWRHWEKFQKGTDKKKPSEAIEEAIKKCICDAKCPDATTVKGVLDTHRFVVLQGAPGCGKTWTANEVSKMFKNENVFFTQFHAETTYSDFVYGIRPDLNGNSIAYKGEKGTLLKAIDRAEEVKQDKENVLLIIDEINRANLANVLGPVFYLFEPNAKRKHTLHLGTIYENDKERPLEYQELPNNLFVLATMNTADKSLAVVDFALRRRFAWVTLRPHKVNIDGFDNEFFEKVDELFSTYATDEELNLQPGQSYFMDKSNRKESIEYGLIPLFKEYFAEGFLLSAKDQFSQLFTAESGFIMFE